MCWSLDFFEEYILTICNLGIFRFNFESWIWVFIPSFPELCILFTVFTLCTRGDQKSRNRFTAPFRKSAH